MQKGVGQRAGDPDMGTTDEHSPINRAIGIPERNKYQDVVAVTVYECLTCQEHSPVSLNTDPTDYAAHAWSVEHVHTRHGGDRTQMFFWNAVRTRFSLPQ